MNPFSNEVVISDNIPIVDVAIAYDFQYSYQTYIFIIRNALYIPTKHYNLIT